MNPDTPTPPASARIVAWLIAGRWLVLLVLIAAIALGLRLEGLDWDGGRFYHPDERSIYLRAECMHLALTEGSGWAGCQNRDFPRDEPGFPGLATFFDKDASPLNPHWFPLGSIIIYLLVAVRFIIDPFMEQVRLQDLASAGRTLAALADTASVVLLFFLGRRLFGPAVGLLAAALTAFTVVNIQVTHFYRPESFVILLALAAFWWMFNVLEHGRRRDHVILGLVIGVTFAFRGSSMPILASVGLTYLALAYRQWRLTPSPIAVVGAVAPKAVLALVVSALAFAVLQPYALLDFHKYVGDLGWEVGIARTAGMVPYTVQYIGTPRTGLYEIRQTALWALGLPLGALAWGGLAATVVAAFRRPRLTDWLLLSWVGALIIGVVPLFEVKFLRYIVPVLPIMTLLGSRWLVEAYRFAGARRVVLRRVVALAIVAVLVATVFYALAFAGIYRRDHPGVQASAWMNENAAPGAVILTDNHWDEGFADLGRFDVSQLPMYEGDTVAKMARVTDQLAEADYIMAYSNRPWGSIARLPERYPYSSAYYHALFAGDLGYELVQGFARYPTFAGVSFVHDPFTRAGVRPPETVPGVETAPVALNLGYADENVVNYDHPLVLVWENTGGLTAAELRGIVLSETVESPEPALLSEEAFARQTAGGTWTDIFEERGPNAWAPWLVWLLAVEVIFLVSLPLSVRLMRWLPDRGVVLARPLGLLIVSWLVWTGASVGLWTFSRGTVVLAVLIVAAVSGVLLCRNRWLIAAAKRHWRYLASVEMLFIAGYLSFVLIRAANPDLWHAWRGGEKPMDLTYLTAVVKSTTFPPFDPWYAGGYINYYYFGFVIVGSLIRLTGIVPEVAYNLAVPMLFAMTLAGAFSVGYNLAEALRQQGRWNVGGRSAIGAGVAAALLVVVLANVDGAVQLLQGAARTLGDGDFGRFDFWRSSRLMPGQISITEFPFWTFLFADLHAHLISIPFQILAVGLAANLVMGARVAASLRRLLPAVVMLAFAVGSLAAINTWDTPAYALLGMAALAIVLFARRQSVLEPALLAKAVLLVAGFWVVLYFAWLPFHENYEAPFAGLRRSQWQTVFWHYLGIHGLLIFIAGSWILVEARRRLPSTTTRWLAGAAAAAAVLLVAILLASVDALRPWTTVAALFLLTMVALAAAVGWLVRRSDRQAPVQLLLIAALVLALGIGMGVDVVSARIDIDRMNTVFKFYLNAWVLFGIVGGVGLWSLWAGGALRLRGGRGLWARGPWIVVLALLVLASAVYPVLGTRARLADRFDTEIGLTLDGRAYQRDSVYGDPGPTNSESDDTRYALAIDADAIDFIRENVEGSPVFLEGVVDHGYRWYPRVAKYAGLPVVVGWRWHQAQQRGDGGAHPGAVDARLNDVTLMYETTDEALFIELAREYGVEYVYVGPTERTYFSAAGLAKFDRMTDSSLASFYRSDEATVYRVRGGAAEDDLKGLGPDDSLPDGPQPDNGVQMEEAVQVIRDILLSVYLVAGILLTLALVVFSLMLYKALRGLIGAATRATENVGKVTEAAVEHVVTPLQEGVSFSSAAGNAFGFATGFIAGLRGRRKRGDKDDKKK